VRSSSLMQGKTGLWWGFAASTIIAMVASSRIYQTLDCGDALKGTAVCRRTNLGIALGCIGFVTGVGMAAGLTKRLVHVNVELGVSAVSFIMWCFGVGFTTFGSGPGSVIGTEKQNCASSYRSQFCLGLLWRRFFVLNLMCRPVVVSSESDATTLCFCIWLREPVLCDVDLLHSHCRALRRGRSRVYVGQRHGSSPLRDTVR
jgi:hypothetical protein